MATMRGRLIYEAFCRTRRSVTERYSRIYISVHGNISHIFNSEVRWDIYLRVRIHILHTFYSYRRCCGLLCIPNLTILLHRLFTGEKACCSICWNKAMPNPPAIYKLRWCTTAYRWCNPVTLCQSVLSVACPSVLQCCMSWSAPNAWCTV